MVHIAANKNTVPSDVSAVVPDGIRMGMKPILPVMPIKYWAISFFFADNLLCSVSRTLAFTSRGFDEEDFVKVADFFDTAVKLANKAKQQSTLAIAQYEDQKNATGPRE